MLVGTFFEGETAILVASSMIHQDLYDAGPTVFFGFAGSFISDWLYYLIGRLNGKFFIDKRPKLRAKLETVENLFRKNQLQILFSYRFLYGFRVIIPIVIGMSHVKPMQYLFFLRNRRIDLGYHRHHGWIFVRTFSKSGYIRF